MCVCVRVSLKRVCSPGGGPMTAIAVSRAGPDVMHLPPIGWDTPRMGGRGGETRHPAETHCPLPADSAWDVSQP